MIYTLKREMFFTQVEKAKKGSWLIDTPTEINCIYNSIGDFALVSYPKDSTYEYVGNGAHLRTGVKVTLLNKISSNVLIMVSDDIIKDDFETTASAHIVTATCSSPSEPKVNNNWSSDFKCPFCGADAYQGLNRTECSKKCQG